MDDIQALQDLNIMIGEKENAGDRDWLAAHLAPRLAFQRADKTLVDFGEFLKGVQRAVTPEQARQTRIEEIELFGDRATVRCIVERGGQEFHNLRLWIRRDTGWELLGWANEPVE